MSWEPEHHHRWSDPDTSAAAAKKAARFAATHKGICMTAIRLIGGSGTHDEIAAVTTGPELNRTQVHKRMSDLRDDGLVEDSGERRPGATSTGEIVWAVISGSHQPQQQTLL